MDVHRARPEKGLARHGHEKSTVLGMIVLLDRIFLKKHTTKHGNFSKSKLKHDDLWLGPCLGPIFKFVGRHDTEWAWCGPPWPQSSLDSGKWELTLEVATLKL